ncbi:MAG: RNA polymerase sigma factor [bacterium]
METNGNFLDFLERCTKGDKKSWDHFVDRYGSLIYTYITKALKRYSYSLHDDERDDIFHRVFLALLEDDYRRLNKFKGDNERSFMAYLREIAFHMTIDFLREQRSFVALEQVQNRITYKDQHKGLATQDLRRILRILKDKLCDRHKYLFKLIYEEEWELTEIAQLMNLSINTLHQLKFRMIKNMIEIAKRENLYHELKTVSSSAIV